MEIKDITNFELDVIEESRQRPVIVDFWAPWCGPCKILGPILEKLAENNQNRWILVKINVEDYQDIAGQYDVQSIPAVKLFSDGEIISEFTGALPENQIVSWLNENIPTESTKKLRELEENWLKNDNESTEKELNTILENEPQNSRAAYFLAKILIFKEASRAKQLIDVARKDPKMIEQTFVIEKITKAIELSKNPDELEDSDLKEIFLDGSKALEQQNFESALEKLIEVVMKDKKYQDQLAREVCIAIFKYLGEDHEISKKNRRRFDMALY